MMKIGLIGSTSFYHTYLLALKQFSHVNVYPECSIDAIKENNPTFEEILLHCERLVFESVSAEILPLVKLALKSGRYVFIEHAHLSAQEMHEIYDIANEGNLYCAVLPTDDFSVLFTTHKNLIVNPSLIDIHIAYPPEEISRLNENLNETIQRYVHVLLYLFRSDIKSINVRQAKIFAPQTDLLAISLDFSNGCTTHMRFSALSSLRTELIKVYQEGLILCFDLINKQTETITAEGFAKPSPQPGNAAMDTMYLKAGKIIATPDTVPAPSQSLLDHYLVLEWAAKIVKKINSFHD